MHAHFRKHYFAIHTPLYPLRSVICVSEGAAHFFKLVSDCTTRQCWQIGPNFDECSIFNQTFIGFEEMGGPNYCILTRLCGPCIAVIAGFFTVLYNKKYLI